MHHNALVCMQIAGINKFVSLSFVWLAYQRLSKRKLVVWLLTCVRPAVRQQEYDFVRRLIFAFAHLDRSLQALFGCGGLMQLFHHCVVSEI